MPHPVAHAHKLLLALRRRPPLGIHRFVSSVVFLLCLFPFPVFSSFHSCHKIPSLVICNFVLALATVIVSRYNCNKDELEPLNVLGLFATMSALP